ncbi:endonuclease III [Hyphomonas adhaerens MHS-3]|uniref:Endonuclease III n=1 Tax=Hyphomonas adhaerens MHS-3 TaxID=1280949 RepID=A0A069E197_9PROT|nr:endonuclease III [Hyphomonas adhaerens]KCZ83441.1 endonuclease III [Hyphomonas adhaerens MHS-3]
MTESPQKTPPRKPAKKRAPRTLGPEKTEKIFAALAHDRPDPKTELEYSSPFTLLVAVALSAQATDVGVNKATRKLFAIADTPEKMLDLGEEGVAEHIKTIGLWRNKAKNVIALSQKILDDFGGEVPRTRDELTTLPGVGRKTANVVMNEVFGEPTIAVDTHIFRVSNRTGLAPGKTPDEVEAGLERVTPPKWKKGAHHWLILHGRYVCKARTPECWRCVIAEWCKYTPKTADPAKVSSLGPKAPKKKK